MKDQVNNAGELLHVDITTLVQIGLFFNIHTNKNLLLH